MLLSVKELLWKPAATDWLENRIAQPKQMADTEAASAGVVVVRVGVKVRSTVGDEGTVNCGAVYRPA